MSPFSSESAWLCLAATSVLGGMLLCRSKSPGQWRRQMLCLAGLWGGACLLSLSLLCSLLLLLLGCFLLCVSSSDQELLPVDQKAVLVTGSDSGFGHALAKYLDKLGFTVFAGVLDEAGPGAEELRKTCSERLSVLQMDVTKPEQIKDTLSKVTEKIKDKGKIPLQMLAAYTSTKAAITMFSSVMRIELSKWGVKVITIQPGGFKTNITGSPDTWDKMETEILDHLSKEIQEDYGRDYVQAHKNHLFTMRDLSCSDITPVLRDIELAISAKNPSPFYAPGRMAYLWICLEAYFPTTVWDYIMQRYFGPKFIPRALRDSSL
ncbi:17-beta-hydroxysteroid dehydrogenase type 2 isoform X2 [Psammomys obesus]|uniref:17-beta-hydroxysteroid dehydrogenase type 2 isoform X2 n=1 Tax=Psammomys obesus TaxID=48139 RepID=UPI0024528CCE|nr:17-beta-hydroxysteroid dehydrogenase type 2 isoform X2 [Psammomys obesus]